jgi:hypothetical protein
MSRSADDMEFPRYDELVRRLHHVLAGLAPESQVGGPQLICDGGSGRCRAARRQRVGELERLVGQLKRRLWPTA